MPTGYFHLKVFIGRRNANNIIPKRSALSTFVLSMHNNLCREDTKALSNMFSEEVTKKPSSCLCALWQSLGELYTKNKQSFEVKI